VVGPTGDLRVDARPSDAIALAVRTHAPLFVSDEVMDEAGAPLEDPVHDDEATEVIDAESIDAEVDEFRDFLATSTRRTSAPPRTEPGRPRPQGVLSSPICSSIAAICRWTRFTACSGRIITRNSRCALRRCRG